MGTKGVRVKMCDNCFVYMPVAQHICYHCGKPTEAAYKRGKRRIAESCARGHHCFIGGRCFHCETPEVKP